MKLANICVRSAVLCIAAGLVLVTVACFHGGVAWIPEAFSFWGNLFGI